MASQEEKDLAHTIDPGCWVSYSGKPVAVKQMMERRRTNALRLARERLEDTCQRPCPATVEERLEALENAVGQLLPGFNR